MGSLSSSHVTSAPPGIFQEAQGGHDYAPEPVILSNCVPWTSFPNLTLTYPMEMRVPSLSRVMSMSMMTGILKN